MKGREGKVGLLALRKKYKLSSRLNKADLITALLRVARDEGTSTSESESDNDVPTVRAVAVASGGGAGSTAAQAGAGAGAGSGAGAATAAAGAAAAAAAGTSSTADMPKSDAPPAVSRSIPPHPSMWRFGTFNAGNLGDDDVATIVVRAPYCALPLM